LTRWRKDRFRSVIPAQAGIQQKETAREADKTLMLTRYAGLFQSTGFPPARE
jgi:hypothetical protein